MRIERTQMKNQQKEPTNEEVGTPRGRRGRNAGRRSAGAAKE